LANNVQIKKVQLRKSSVRSYFPFLESASLSLLDDVTIRLGL
jgi:hypothetical protein